MNEVIKTEELLSADQKYKIELEDYSQSANTIFHFMKEPEYLYDILRRRAIIPRYCQEDVDYLDIKNEGVDYKEILVLQKCFCDIPLHKITQQFQLEGRGENFAQLTEAEKNRAAMNNTHPDFYGEYAIGFSKTWGERNNLQPIHYINKDSDYSRMNSNWINYILGLENVDDIFPDEILIRLSGIKPLRGFMKRNFIKDDGKTVEIEINKNFYDEQEWRYVPAPEKLAKCELRSVIANPLTVELKGGINRSLVDKKYADLWLRYSYSEIRYIIVPNIEVRNEMIQVIAELSDNLFETTADVMTQKYILFSKILVLDEIKKDW